MNEESNAEIIAGTAKVASEVHAKVEDDTKISLEEFEKLKAILGKAGWEFEESYHTIDEGSPLVPIPFGIFRLTTKKTFTGCDDGDDGTVDEEYRIGYCDRWRERAIKESFLPFLKLIQKGDY